MLPKILYNFEKTKSYKNNTFVVVGWKSNHRLTTWQISDKSALLNFKINFVAFLKKKNADYCRLRDYIRRNYRVKFNTLYRLVEILILYTNAIL